MVNVTVPATHWSLPGSLKVSTVAVALVRVSVLMHASFVSWAVVPFAAIVNVMLLCSPRLGSATANIVAVPVQVPAKEDGIVAPAACAVAEAGVLACPAGEVLARPADELAAVPGGAEDGDPRVSSRTPATTTAAAAAAPPAARNGPRRDRFGRISAAGS